MAQVQSFQNDLDALIQVNSRVQNPNVKRHLRAAAVSLAMSLVNDNFEKPTRRIAAEPRHLRTAVSAYNEPYDPYDR